MLAQDNSKAPLQPLLFNYNRPNPHSTAARKKALDDARKLLSEMAGYHARGIKGDCIIYDIGDLQIKCHAPKQGNRRISYEFYGTDPKDSLGCNYTKKQAVALIAEFALAQLWKAPIYREQWLEIAGKVGVEVPERRPIKPKDEIYYSPLTGRPTMALGDKAVQQVLAERIVGLNVQRGVA